MARARSSLGVFPHDLVLTLWSLVGILKSVVIRGDHLRRAYIVEPGVRNSSEGRVKPPHPDFLSHIEMKGG